MFFLAPVNWQCVVKMIHWVHGRNKTGVDDDIATFRKIFKKHKFFSKLFGNESSEPCVIPTKNSSSPGST